MDVELLDSMIYKLKKGSYFYGDDEKLKTYILTALSDESNAMFYVLLKGFINEGLDEIDALRLHLAFRKEVNSGRYQKQKALYDLFIEDKLVSQARASELFSLL